MVLGPALAMDSTPGPVCLSCGDKGCGGMGVA